MSVLSSVFNRRKGIQKRFNNLTQIVRSHSPPSPASFASPDLTKSFDPYNLYAASQSSVNQAHPLPPDVPPKRGSSPKVLLDFTPDNMSDWFPAELLQGQSNEVPRRPERNVSLGVTHRRDASGGSQRGMFTNGMTMSRIDETESRRKNSFASDDVIVIEAPRGRDVSSFVPIHVRSGADLPASRLDRPWRRASLAMHSKHNREKTYVSLCSHYAAGILTSVLRASLRQDDRCPRLW